MQVSIVARDRIPIQNVNRKLREFENFAQQRSDVLLNARVIMGTDRSVAVSAKWVADYVEIR